MPLNSYVKHEELDLSTRRTNYTALSISLGSESEDKMLERIKLPRGIYLNLCPNCGGPIEDNRLLFRNACSICMGREDIIKIKDVIELVKHVKDLKPESSLRRILDIKSFVEGFREFFIKCVGNSPWNLQISWAIRLVQNQSFALIAPTGVGKTTFGLVIALYLAYRFGKKSYIVVPTTVLVRLYEEKIREYMEKVGILVQVVALHSKISQKRKIELENIIREGSFDILITTSKYLQKNFKEVFNEFLLKGHKIDFVFVDDVDAVMKGSKAIDMILKLIGFSDEDVEGGYKLISLRQKVAKCEVSRDEKSGSMCYEDGKHVREILEELQHKILSRRSNCGILVISSATGRARGRRVRLFRELLGFHIGSAVEMYRNVIDTFIPMPIEDEKLLNVLADLINKLGDGGLIYVPIDKGLDYAYKLRDILRSRGIEVEVLSSRQPKVLEKFIKGEFKALIGVATYYGLLVRGIDIPEKIRYALFVGIPRHKISLSQVGFNPHNLLRLLIVLSDIVQDNVQRETMIKLIAKIKRIIMQTSAERLRSIIEELSHNGVAKDSIALTIVEAQKLVSSLLSDRNIIEALKKYPKTSITEEKGVLYLMVPDAPTYIQASGRTSRLFVGGVTTGLSVILIDDERLANGLVDRIRFFIEDFMLKPFNSINIDEILHRVDEDRELVKMIKMGRIAIEHIVKELKIKTVLFVVESPNKARTIALFFGRPTYREFNGLRVYETNVGDIHLVIASSGGHVFEVVEEELQENSIYGIAVAKINNKNIFLPKYDYIKKCLDCGTQFVKGDKCPLCGSSRYRSSRSVIEALQRIALEVEEVIIATDPDSEGEKIGYDIAIALAPFAKSIVRAEFHEVTRKSILNALRNPRGIDILLVEAQITRRIEDRWLGFALSDYVTNKLKTLNLIPWVKEGRLSAGRVQTPVLGRVIEMYINRVRTLRKSKLLFLEGGLVLEIPQHVLENVLKEKVKRLPPSKVEVRFIPISKSVELLYPLPPFTTDEMIAEAYRILKLNAVEVMNIAQDLFELGLITYHRTDSTRISSAGMNVAKDYLVNTFGDKYVEFFEPRAWGAGGAHEGIRPTRPIDATKLRELIAEGVIEIPVRLTVNHFKLYDLIFRRFIASQMKPSVIEKTMYKVVIKVDGNDIVQHTIEVVTGVLKPGFMGIYTPIKVVSMPSTEFTLRPLKIVTAVLSDYPMLSQGDIIRWMKEAKIGRPSTYAKIVDTITKRGYVVSTKSMLIPSIEGFYVYTLLAGTNFAEEVLDIDSFLAILKNVYKRKEYVIDNIRKVLSFAHDNISKMVSVKRTKELYEKIQAIEENKVYYMDIVHELFREVCANILYELAKGVEICRKIQA